VRYGGGFPAVINWLCALLIFPGMALLMPSRYKLLSVGAGAVVMVGSLGVCLAAFRVGAYFWNPVNHVAAWVFSLVWLAIQKADPSLVESGPVELEPRDTLEKATLPPPSEGDFIGSIPSSDSARHVRDKLAAAMPAPGPVPMAVPIDQFRSLAGGMIVRPLGAGGMADVYLIWNPRLDSYRAVKVLKPGQPERFLTRFETEIRILSNLNHPNIVQCYSVGDWHGLPYLEMEYIYGMSFEEIISKRGSLTPAEATAVGILVCRALQYAHQQVVSIYGKTYRGVIHRDLKPANIMLSRGGRIKLTDFGIARPGEVSLNTADAGTIIGTLPYLAPEQAEGQELTSRADIYALGVTLYEFLSGARAFPQGEITALLTAKATGSVKHLSSDGKIPESLAAIVNKSMATEAEKRYESAFAMEKELETVLRAMNCRGVIEGLVASCFT
jgi:hypothetical protein